MDLGALIAQMRQRGDYRTLATDPTLQFGTEDRPFLGASLLPERPQEDNVYYEEAIRFFTVIASDNTRYSPPVKKGAALVSSMLVELGEADNATSFSAKQFDALRRLVLNGDDQEAAAELIGLNGRVLVQGLLEFNEKQRWQAIINAQVPITINGTTKTILYLDPAGARFNAGGSWSSDAYDPFEDLAAGAQLLADNGHPLRRIISRTKPLTLLSRNEKVAARAGRPMVSSGGTLTVAGPRTVSRAEIAAMFQAEGWPTPEVYDRKYHTETGAVAYIEETVMVLIGETGESVDMEADDVEFTLDNTLGYVGIGVAAGETEPGRVVRNWYHDDKPPRIDAQSWQTSLSVLTAPAAIVVIKNIS